MNANRVTCALWTHGVVKINGHDGGGVYISPASSMSGTVC